MEDNYENNVEKNQFETPKRYSVKNSDKTQDNETIITQNTYELLVDSDESDASNNKVILSNKVTASIPSRQAWNYNTNRNNM